MTWLNGDIKMVGAQGEVRIYVIDALPAGVCRVTPEGGQMVIGYSETGHHHVLVAESAEVFEDQDPPEGMRILYALLDSPGTLEHQRSFDTHAPHVLSPGLYMFTNDREYDHYAELARRVSD
jgi:hypothetical protein